MAVQVTTPRDFREKKCHTQEDHAMRRRAFGVMFIGCALFWTIVILAIWQVWG